MRLGLRLLFVVCLIQGIAAFFVLRIFGQEIKPSVREVMEEQLVDAANILAEFAAPELQTAQLAEGNFAKAVASYRAREVKANIWGLSKETLDFRVYVTDARGVVVYDSEGRDLGADYSQWRDVLLTLEGKYGARSSRGASSAYRVKDAPESLNTMYVAAAVRAGGKIIGSLTVAKPHAAVEAFIERAERRVLLNGLAMIGLSTLVGVVVTLWVVWQVRRLRAYAQNVQLDASPPPLPDAPGELGDLAKSLEGMRQRLDGTQYVQDYVRALTHELKSPIAAVTASAELLQDDMPAAQRAAFAKDIAAQGERMQRLVQRMLELARLEQGVAVALQPVAMAPWLEALAQEFASKAAAAGVALRMDMPTETVFWHTDAAQLAMAARNLIDNAIDFSPPGGEVTLTLGAHSLAVRDNGPGVPDYALARLGERFFTTERPDGTRSGTGLGIAIAQRIAQRLGLTLRFENAQPGLIATISR
jgi:two-component system, OmpR family, sensor histidine kinase CreC